MNASGISIVGGFLVAILSFVLGSMIGAVQDERKRIDDILKLQASVVARLEDHLTDHREKEYDDGEPQ